MQTAAADVVMTLGPRTAIQAFMMDVMRSAFVGTSNLRSHNARWQGL